MKRIFIACVLTLSLLSSGAVLRAADGPASASDSGTVTEKPKRMPFYGSVKAVDVKAMTFTLVGKEKDRVFYVTEATKIHHSGEARKLADVQVGRKVGGLARANTAGRWEVATLNLGVKQERSSRTAAKSEEVATE